jgi:DNA-binding response OmpR family regulator
MEILKIRRVFTGEDEIILKNKEFELLCFLAGNSGTVFSKEHLYDQPWGTGYRFKI